MKSNALQRSTVQDKGYCRLKNLKIVPSYYKSRDIFMAVILDGSLEKAVIMSILMKSPNLD